MKLTTPVLETFGNVAVFQQGSGGGPKFFAYGSKARTVLMFALTLTLTSCDQGDGKKSAAQKKSPAKVSATPNEANLADVELTSKAFERLGITTAAVVQKSISPARTLGGEVMVPTGESAMVVAPVAGTIELPEGATLPKPGSAVEKGRPIFKFVPLLTPERFVPTPAERAQIASAQAQLISLQMAADGDVLQFTEQVTAARIALRRAEQLQRDRVGSERAVDDAKAQLAIAEAGQKVSMERKKVLDRLSSDIEKGAPPPFTIDAPIDGVVRSLPVTLGQTVSTGTPLFEIGKLDILWVRVPVYVGLLNSLQLDQPARVSAFGSNDSRTTFTATPIQAPPTADPLSSTADVFYALANDDGRFRPGERVSVSIPEVSEAEARVVPSKAVLYDIHGNTWVYVQFAPLHFRRSRVSLRGTVDDLAVIQDGPDEGTEVVVDGAAELFGTEFGTGK